MESNKKIVEVYIDTDSDSESHTSSEGMVAAEEMDWFNDGEWLEYHRSSGPLSSVDSSGPPSPVDVSQGSGPLSPALDISQDGKFKIF